MKIKILPYYCPHCHKFKTSGEIYKSNGVKQSKVSGLSVEGWLPYCKGCDTPVEETKPVIERAIQELFEQGVNK